MLYSVDEISTLLAEDAGIKDKDAVVQFAQAHTIKLASERFDIPRSTIRAWLKEQKIPSRPVYNSPGQGRKITYSRDLDLQIAEHVRSLIAEGKRVTVQDMCTYARKLVQQENPDFTASTGWAQRFLSRNKIDLNSQASKKPSAKHGGNSDSTTENRGRPLSYSTDTDNHIAEWVRSRTEKGEAISNSELRKYARDLVCKENPSFTGSASWAQNFLLRHRLKFTSYLTHTCNDKPKSSPQPSSSPDINITIPNIQYITSSVAGSGDNQVTSTTSTAAYTSSVEDTVNSILLASENLPVDGHLTQAQAAATLALSELTSDPALVDLLNSTQDSASFNHASLDASGNQLAYLNQLTELVGTSSVTASQSLLTGVFPQSPQPAQTSSMVHDTDINVVGYGTRPLSYLKETDQALATWVKEQQQVGHKVTFASLRAYAKKLISPENSHFNASVGWVTPFLLRHNLDLKLNAKKGRQTRKTLNPRKLQAKEEEEVVDVTNEDEEEEPTEEATPMEESEIEIQSLGMIPQLMEQLSEEGERGLEQLVPPAKATDQATPLSKRTKSGCRSRHTLAEKLEVVRLMREFNVAGHYVSRMLGIANSTLSGWIKLVDQKGEELEALSVNTKRSNRMGQGRPLSYSREKDDAIAAWVRQQQELGISVSSSDLCGYATNIIVSENPGFVASVGWKHKFLQRHSLQLLRGDKTMPSEEQHTVPLPVQTEEVCTDDFAPEVEEVCVVEKTYPDAIEDQLVKWTKDGVAENGRLSLGAFCKHAEDLILPFDNMFVATLGWAFRFLHHHNIFLDPKTSLDVSRKRTSSSLPPASITPKKPNLSVSMAAVASAMGISPESLTVSSATSNLCEAILSRRCS